MVVNESYRTPEQKNACGDIRHIIVKAVAGVTIQGCGVRVKVF